MLEDMGFTAGQAAVALRECGSSVERAVEWLFSHAAQLPAGLNPPRFCPGPLVSARVLHVPGVKRRLGEINPEDMLFAVSGPFCLLVLIEGGPKGCQFPSCLDRRFCPLKVFLKSPLVFFSFLLYLIFSTTSFVEPFLASTSVLAFFEAFRPYVIVRL